MGLSRRTVTKEFKLAAVRRLEEGVSIGEAARALEANPNVLHRWRREFRQWRLHRLAEGSRHHHQHVAQGQPLGQRHLRVIHEDAQIRRGASQRIPGSGRGPCRHWRVPGESLQPQAAALGTRLSATRRVRAKSQEGRCAAALPMSSPSRLRPLRTPLLSV
jgi:transposase-like protein